MLYITSILNHFEGKNCPLSNAESESKRVRWVFLTSLGKEFDQQAWDRKFEDFEDKYRPAFEQIVKAVLVGVVLGLAVRYFLVDITGAVL